MKNEVTVKIFVNCSTFNPFNTEFKAFSDSAEATDYISSLVAKGVSFSVTWSLWEEGECLDAEYTDRESAEEDAAKLNAGEEL